MSTPLPPASPLRLFYIDDSGAEATGHIVYSWIETTPDGWREGLRAWLDLRRALYVDYLIPPAVELHATKFAGGRGRPSTRPTNLTKTERWAAITQSLAVIGSTPALRVGTVHRHTTARRAAFHQEQAAVYEALVASLDRRLGAARALGMIVMDGNGEDPAYYDAHRGLKLAHRRIIEDPLFQHSHRSQWVQMADLTAWTAYQALARQPGKQFAWDWYDRHLRPADVNGGPTSI
jgi:hypothetical protein